MEQKAYKAELHPEWKFVDEHPAPLATKVLLLTKYGSAIIGHWYKGGGFIAWAGLPKLTNQQKEKYNAYLQGTLSAP